MNTVEGATKVATAAVSAMASTPLAVALLIVNVCFLATASYVLKEIATNSKERNKAQTELIVKLVSEITDCRQGPKT